MLLPAHKNQPRQLPPTGTPALQPAAAAQDQAGLCDIAGLLKDHTAISLDETNRKAKMLSRIDNKYVVNLEQFQLFLDTVRTQYAALRIDGINQFSYSSCYYDDNFGCYFEHHQGRRQRFKVRTREYVDSGLKFFEIKLKGIRGLTNKHRINSEFLVHPKIEGSYLEMLNQLYARQYKKTMPFRLTPALLVHYKRCTLVAVTGSERVTIDYALQFEIPGQDCPAVRIGNDFIIVETKSADGRGIADLALKNLKIRKASKCSKYCIGLNLTDSVSKNNVFLDTIKHVRRNVVTPDLEQISRGTEDNIQCGA